MNKKDMFLESPSGFYLPFDVQDDEGVEIMLGYGEQTHPATGKPFFHHGIDFVCDHQDLLAVASGLVMGVGTDDERGNFIAVKYGKYIVRYAHISEAYAPYGAKVVAGQQIAKSGDFLHIDVTFDGEELDPEEFLSMLIGNMTLLVSLGMDHFPTEGTGDIEVHTKYDDYQEEIGQLMNQYFVQYWLDLCKGKWQPSEKVELLARSIMSHAAEGGCFYENIPSFFNPVGLGKASGALVGESQNLLIEDFLGYLAACHQVYVPSFSDEQKKKLMNTLQRKGKS